MLLKVQDNLEDNAAAYADHAQIAPTKVLLDTKIQAIIEAAGRATQDLTGYAEDKQLAREALELFMYKVAKGVNAYAEDNNMNTLANKARYVKTEIEKLQDTELHYKATELSTITTPIIALLAGYRVVQDDLDKLNDRLADYFATIPEPKDAIEARALAGKQVDRHQTASRLLLEKLDRYVDSYRTDNIDLWDEYQLARAIDNPTGGGGGAGSTQQEFTGTVPPMNNQLKGPVTYNAATPVALQNNSNVTLGFQLQQSGAPMGMMTNVPPMSTSNTTMGTMAPGGNEFRIINYDPMQSAAYKITVG